MGLLDIFQDELDEAKVMEQRFKPVAEEYSRSPQVIARAETKADLFEHAVSHLALLYEDHTGRWAGTSTSRTTGDRGGPFVRFVASVLEVMEPNSSRKGLGASIAKILPLLDTPLVLEAPWKSPRKWTARTHRGFRMVR